MSLLDPRRHRLSFQPYPLRGALEPYDNRKCRRVMATNSPVARLRGIRPADCLVLPERDHAVSTSRIQEWTLGTESPCAVDFRVRTDITAIALFLSVRGRRTPKQDLRECSAESKSNFYLGIKAPPLVSQPTSWALPGGQEPGVELSKI